MSKTPEPHPLEFETPKQASTPSLPADLMFELLGYPNFKCVYINENGGVVDTASKKRKDKR